MPPRRLPREQCWCWVTQGVERCTLVNATGGVKAFNTYSTCNFYSQMVSSISLKPYYGSTVSSIGHSPMAHHKAIHFFYCNNYSSSSTYKIFKYLLSNINITEHFKIASIELIFNCCQVVVQQFGKLLCGSWSIHTHILSYYSQVVKLCKINSCTFNLITDLQGNVNMNLDSGWTPLMHACFHAQEYIVKLLLDKGANPNLGSGRYKYLRYSYKEVT